MHDGLILALVSIGVVFAALLVLYLFYGLMGNLFMRPWGRFAPCLVLMISCFWAHS